MTERNTATPGWTCFGGALVRHVDGWRWLDGVAEPRMRDVPPAQADLRTRLEATDDGLVELPYRLVEFFDPLTWVTAALARGDYELDISTGSYPALGRTTVSSAQCAPELRRQAGSSTGVMVVLVPRLHWHRWCARSDLLPAWSSHDEADLEREATHRGWRGWAVR